MKHERLLKYRTGAPTSAPGDDSGNDFCEVVIAGETIYLRGQVGMDRQGRTVGPGAAEQAEQAMWNVDYLLRRAGATLDDIVKITVYITDRAHRGPVYQVIGRWLRGVHPVSTGLIVSGLGRPEWVMEIDVVAVRQGAVLHQEAASETAARS